jgi:hypothetical protein
MAESGGRAIPRHVLKIYSQHGINISLSAVEVYHNQERVALEIRWADTILCIEQDPRRCHRRSLAPLLFPLNRLKEPQIAVVTARRGNGIAVWMGTSRAKRRLDEQVTQTQIAAYGHLIRRS